MTRAILLAFVLVLIGSTTPVTAGAQPAPPDAPSGLRLDVDELNPRVISTTTPDVVITGTITNVGDRKIEDLEVRLQRGEVLADDKAMREALSTSRPTESASSKFVSVAKTLEPGQSAELTVSVPVRGTADSLEIEKPGVYPLLVNVNGKPEYGGTARLTALSLLLPVLSVPGGTAVPPPSNPAKLSVLWPLIDDHPRILPSGGDQTVLSDDELANSLSSGGRLYGLVSTMQAEGTTNPNLLNSFCFAIDPDLLDTADRMARGYLVRGADGQPVPGKGATAADAWLDRVRALTRGRCVIALPYADADLVALSRSGTIDLQQLALSGTGVLQRILGSVQPQPGVVWPAGGTLDQRTLGDLAGAGPTAVLANASRVVHPQGASPWALGANNSRVVPVDELVSASLQVQSGRPESNSGTATTTDERSVSVQNGLAALTYRAAFQDRPDRSVLIAPPRRWSAPASELTVFLKMIETLYTGSYATSEGLSGLVSGQAKGTSGGLDYTGQDSTAEIPPTITDRLVRANGTQRDLVNAMGEDATTKVKPAKLIEPMQYGLVRSMSSAWRGHPDRASLAVAEVESQLAGLISQVNVLTPGRPISLGSQDAPLPLTIVNPLPVTVFVQVKLGETPGLRADAIPVLAVPARGNLPVFAESEVLRSGRFTVDVTLRTPSGATLLGTPARLELNSTSYGTITLVITGTAAGALFLLSGLRIFRRVRKARAAKTPQGDELPTQ